MNEKKLAKALYESVHAFLKQLREESDEDFLRKIIQDYVENLPFEQRIVVKGMLKMPWNDVLTFFYKELLKLGEENGRYRSVEETIVKIVREYLV